VASVCRATPNSSPLTLFKNKVRTNPWLPVHGLSGLSIPGTLLRAARTFRPDASGAMRESLRSA
jgi:hypothetical protein